MAEGVATRTCVSNLFHRLLKNKLSEREVHSIAHHVKAAGSPTARDVSGFGVAASKVDEATVRQLQRRKLIDRAQNIVLSGGLGAGMTQVATARGVHTIAHCRRKWTFSSSPNEPMPSNRRRPGSLS
ncbi:ATP-binding protein [Paracoccus sp. T5]